MRNAPASDERAARAPLLSFSHVKRSIRDGNRASPLLKDVTFELGEGESAGLFGRPRSGKSTLLRLACALEPVEAGAVCFAGHDLATLSGAKRAALLRDEIALLCEGAWLPSAGEAVLDRVITAIGGAGVSLRDGRRRALAALDRVEAAGCAAEPALSLSRSQRARVELAAALVREPRLLLVDEPLPTPNPSERDRICALVREVAKERGVALLIASEDLSALQGLQSLMSISAGEVCSSAGSGATVVSLAARR